MHIACLMPTYGRRASLLNNSIACFCHQSYGNRSLWIYDDLGTLIGARCDMPGVYILARTNRSHDIGSKYNELVDHMRNVCGDSVDAFAVWDDDDVYGPDYLFSHALAIEHIDWSKPSRIVSAYHSPPMEEPGDGRFHGSIVVRASAVKRTPWVETRRATFDQEYIAALSKNHGPPADPCVNGPPQYVYRWQTSGGGHCSGLMGSDDWYEKYQPDSREPINELKAEFDDNTRTILQSLFQCADA